MWKKTFFVLLSLCAAVLARADVLLSWDPQGLRAELGGWPDPWAPTSVARNVVVSSGLKRGPGLREGSLNNAWGSNIDFDSKSREAAEQAGQYFTFALAPAAGHVLELTGIDLNVRLSEATLERGVWYQWEYRIGGGEFVPIGTPREISAAAATAAGQTVDVQQGISQPTADFTGIAALRRVEGPVTLRLVSWSDRIGRYYFNIGRFAGDDLVLHGLVKRTR